MPKTFEDKPMFPLPVEAITIAEWCPNPDKENPTQVHLIFELEEADFAMVLRFKGTKSLDEIIYELIRARREVWSDAPEIHENERS